MTVTTKIAVFSDIKSLAVYICTDISDEAVCLHLWTGRLTLNMEERGQPETLVLMYQATRRNIPEDSVCN